MVRRSVARRVGASRSRRAAGPRARRVWLEVGGQQRLLRLHARLQLRRQLIDRWSTVIDEADDRITRRLENLGGDVRGYDAQLSDSHAGEDYGDTEDDDIDEPDDHKSPAVSARASAARPRKATPRKTSPRKTSPAAKRAATKKTPGRRR